MLVMENIKQPVVIIGNSSRYSEQGWNEAWEDAAAKNTVAFARRVWSY